jgi:type I restriction enzyme S subunit
LSELPQSWVHTQLGEVATFEMGQAPPGSASNFEGVGTIFVKAGEFGPRFPIVREWTTQPLKFAKSGDVLICVVGATAGKLNLAIDCAIGRSVAAIRPTQPLLQDLLYYQLIPQVETLRKASSGSAQGVISRSQLANIEISIPPVAEQQRLVRKLNDLTSKIDTCRERLDRVPQILKRFREAVLEAAVSGRLTEEWRRSQPRPDVSSSGEDLTIKPHTRRGVLEKAIYGPSLLVEEKCPTTWARANVAALLVNGTFLDVKDGNHGANHPTADEFVKEGVPFITAAQVNDFKIDYDTAHKLTSARAARLNIGFSHPGDVILTHKGTVGRVAIATQESVLTPQTTYYRADPSRLLPRYGMYFMASPQFRTQLDAIKSQTTRDFVPITAQYSLVWFIPPTNEQAEIVRRLDEIFASTEALQRRYADTIDLVANLTPSVLAKAFRGELLPQDPNDEPAGEMLERMRAERLSGEDASISQRRPGSKAPRRRAESAGGRRLRASSV